MSIDAISSIGASAMDTVQSNAISPSRVGANFLDAVGAGVDRVDSSLKVADNQLRALAAGEDVALHDVMIALESARIELTLIAEVRNRIVEGYQEMMRMQL